MQPPDNNSRSGHDVNEEKQLSGATKPPIDETKVADSGNLKTQNFKAQVQGQPQDDNSRLKPKKPTQPRAQGQIQTVKISSSTSADAEGERADKPHAC
ncbi:hypothetical protein TWF718_000150 [Orbilia javanica]|uniref:Uncharacterized protein n=1 Tax=Orbilia javanica TaxID=47235 RepID=A0AAN8RFN8_9PEZI